MPNRKIYTRQIKKKMKKLDNLLSICLKGIHNANDEELLMLVKAFETKFKVQHNIKL